MELDCLRRRSYDYRSFQGDSIFFGERGSIVEESYSFPIVAKEVPLKQFFPTRVQATVF